MLSVTQAVVVAACAAAWAGSAAGACAVACAAGGAAVPADAPAPAACSPAGNPVCTVRVLKLHVVHTAAGAYMVVLVHATQHNELEPAITSVPHTRLAALLYSHR